MVDKMNKKAVIFYFSQSGNSLYCAKEIAKAMGNTTLVSIPEAVNNNEYKYEDYEKVGFIIPLYYMSMPNMVKEFISKLEISKDSYIFSVVTRASSKGRIFYDMDKLLNEKELRINYGEYITFPDSYIKFTGEASEKKRPKRNEEGEKSLGLITKRIISEDIYRAKEGLILKVVSLLVYSIWKSRLKVVNKSFKVNSACNGCGICEKTCPARNISIVNNKPTWSDKCEDCMACVQHCPQKAIYFNSKTINKKRYINKNIELKELLYKR